MLVFLTYKGTTCLMKNKYENSHLSEEKISENKQTLPVHKRNMVLAIFFKNSCI